MWRGDGGDRNASPQLAGAGTLDAVAVEAEFTDADGTVRREPSSRCWDVAFERVLPVRGFPSFRGQRNRPGLWWFASTGEHVGHESWLERDRLMALDADPGGLSLWRRSRCGCTGPTLVPGGRCGMPRTTSPAALTAPAWSSMSVPTSGSVTGTRRSSRPPRGFAHRWAGSTSGSASWTRSVLRTCAGWPATGIPVMHGRR
jgi:hypothetical protein